MQPDQAWQEVKHKVVGNIMDILALLALIVSVVVFGYTAWRDRVMDRRMKQVEAEQQRAQSEATQRRSKTSAPYFLPSQAFVSNVYDRGENGQPIVWLSMNQNILSAQNQEIKKEAPKGTAVILVLDNHGKGARKIKLSGDIPDAEIRQEPPLGSANDLIFLRYPYSPSQHGQVQRISLSFESEDGYDLTHVYETRHGIFEFHRVEPK
ncbi:MAG: hypothetical protein HY343_09955 [Lentisphaerae bacterium]|nr:hypothetical protein [Lentisphaerota bacterium]